MAEGFKKYFNGTTINGRANVAKATYATLALLYIFYRMRKGGSKEQSQLASGKCSCESETGPGPHSDPGIYEVDPDCSVCRERSEKAMTEYDKEQQRKAAQEEDDGCRDDPPPPPSGGSGGQPRRKCPCEEPSRRVEGSVKHSSHHITGHSTTNSSSHSSSNKVRGHQFQSPYQYQQRYSQSSAAQAQAEQVRPASALVGQVHDAVYRVFRGVVGAMFGGSTINTSSGSGEKAEGQTPGGIASASDSSAAAASATSPSSSMVDEQEEEEERDDGQDYDGSEETPLKRRTAPRSCVPTSHDMPDVVGLEEGHYLYQNQPEESYSPPAREAYSGPESSKSHKNENDYSGFTDGFASGLFFGGEDQ
ncbi:uncharacterized protein Dana_GF19492 [Drosophila ananassae]|uniref:Uncharacterized protein n=1 Tax=Drosophila ananassae TaxID=7217 RepID=B3MXM5_DROAN|nr:uncharacterized protein LOC6502249 [Drosophila ananassae]EDV38490.2 uncharacterized protein Dana_GF19492 [Drosophila ananassae]